MIGLDIGVSGLAEQIKKIADADKIVGVEFSRAAHLVGTDVVKDLQGGVSVLSGELKYGINSDVTMLNAPEVETLFKAVAMGANGYDYAARLDKDGRLHWGRGRFAGRRTFGWFSYAGPRIARKIAKRRYQSALDDAVKNMVVK